MSLFKRREEPASVLPVVPELSPVSHEGLRQTMRSMYAQGWSYGPPPGMGEAFLMLGELQKQIDELRERVDG